MLCTREVPADWSMAVIVPIYIRGKICSIFSIFRLINHEVSCLIGQNGLSQTAKNVSQKKYEFRELGEIAPIPSTPDSHSENPRRILQYTFAERVNNTFPGRSAVCPYFRECCFCSAMFFHFLAQLTFLDYSFYYFRAFYIHCERLLARLRRMLPLTLSVPSLTSRPFFTSNFPFDF